MSKMPTGPAADCRAFTASRSLEPCRREPRLSRHIMIPPSSAIRLLSLLGCSTAATVDVHTLIESGRLVTPQQFFYATMIDQGHAPELLFRPTTDRASLFAMML